MNFSFTKYHGTGNDFILIDDRENLFPHNNEKLIRNLCTRRFGIGADGLILIRLHEKFDFEMVYFNADGKRGSMCGNGGRCAVHFASSLGIGDENINFLAYDGPHEAKVTPDIINLKMQNPGEIKTLAENDYFIDTGSPHYIRFVESTGIPDFTVQAKKIRNSEDYREVGVNVNFVSCQSNSEKIVVRTFERGVEEETFSCGTGVVAASLAASFFLKNKPGDYSTRVKTAGGELEVDFQVNSPGTFSGIWLKGPAKKVYQGNFDIENFK